MAGLSAPLVRIYLVWLHLHRVRRLVTMVTRLRAPWITWGDGLELAIDFLVDSKMPNKRLLSGSHMFILGHEVF